MVSASLGIRASLTIGMGQKRLDSFLASQGSKRSKATSAAGSDAKPPGTTAASAKTRVCSPHEDPAAEAASPAPPPAGPSHPPLAAVGPEALRAAQVAELQAMRAHANRNCALAKQAVIASEKSGTLPVLADLLVEQSWRRLVADQLESDYFRSLGAFVQQEWAGGHLVFPPKAAVFRAFNSCPVDRVRVVILGQDPYHGIGQAMGLSFSVPEGKQIPSSLRNMYKELRDDVGCPPANHGCLEKWAHQGVLLLNAVLTVRSAQPASHAKRGWETFTDEAVARLSRERTGIVFLLWGRYAQAKGQVIDRSKHHVLTAAHPSGLSASRGFFGCRHFSEANKLLEAAGQLPIDWCLE